MFVDEARAGKSATQAALDPTGGAHTGPGVLNGGMDAPEPTPPDPEVARAADRSLIGTVEGLTDDQLAAPSLLPGWTRAHVVAHLALNAEALTGVLRGAASGEPVPMYPSQAVRDSDIEELAGASRDELRARLVQGTEGFAEAAADPPDPGDARFDRVPGGPSLPVAAVRLMRWREVEIHHADLDAGYTRADWTDDFTVALLDSMAHRPWLRPGRLQATDLGRSWEYGDRAGGDVPTISGQARDLGWWATGRGTGEGLTTDHDTLPEVQGW